MNGAEFRELLPRVTEIGSLPHHNVDAALEHSLRATLPFLGQIPIRNPWEFMLAQALERFPGLETDAGANVRIDRALYLAGAAQLKAELERAFKNEAYESFEPSSAGASLWKPFLWELGERHAPIAKVQISGPLTTQWALRFKDGTPVDRDPDAQMLIYRLVLARALAMVIRLRALGVQPVIFVDEPGLYCFSDRNPQHIVGIEELKVFVKTLKKHGAFVGIHCCSNTDWSRVLSVEIDLLSIDTELSLDHLLSDRNRVDAFLDRGGRFSFGCLPTSKPSSMLLQPDVEQIYEQLRGKIARAWPENTDLQRTILREALYTPACGLAYHSPADAEALLETLLLIEKRVRQG